MSKKRLSQYGICSIICLLICSCSRDDFPTEPVYKSVLPYEAVVAKWHQNHTAAISLAYDHGAPTNDMNKQIQQYVLENGITLDYEIVTERYLKYPFLKDYLVQTLIPSGFGYFGHGHSHINHDNLYYDQALASFKECYDTMVSFGLKPIAYAYPEGAGHKCDTREALENAGFLSGRMHFTKDMTNPYIVPDDQLEPRDWFGLPTLVMQDYAFMQCSKCVNDDEELKGYLEQAIVKKAWIILTYHAIGEEQNYGFFKWSEFQKNIKTIKEYDFWCASLNDLTLYIRERKNAVIEGFRFLDEYDNLQKIEFVFSDDLPNEVYDQPLTILFELPYTWIGPSFELWENSTCIDTVTFNSRQGMISVRPSESLYKLTKIH
ncbi:hypothetical protein JXJ21_19475 [candidate division KSB1 bacterium]|nr:hypothetical protein [candidate division KSB1 bacterium]